MSEKIALVTGGNRGIGLQVCKELGKLGCKVILTSRDEKKGNEQAKQLQGEGLDVLFQSLDVNDERSMDQLTLWITQNFNRLDILINNAGILLDWNKETTSDVLKSTLETNVIGPFLLTKKLSELMRKQHYGRIVNVSSEAGQLAHMGSSYPAYSISKAALNAVTKVFSTELASFNILVNSVCPGWVKTDMGGVNAPRSVEKGAETIVWAATLPDNGPTGGFFQDKRPLDW